MRILLLEDDDAIAMGLKYSLEKEGYEVVHHTRTKDIVSGWESRTVDLCILDINLPDGNGYDVCKFIKSKEDIPVIFLTASDAEVNVVMGLELGADDYICKPFRVNELMARIKTVLRRNGRNNGATKEDSYIEINNIRIYVNEAKVTSLDAKGAEEAIELTALEYRLLLVFGNNRGTVLTVYIKRLRDKIEGDPANPKIIKTVRGLGYIVEK